MYFSLRRRFENKIERVTESGCWIWMGSLNDSGYAKYDVNRKSKRVHRALYEMTFGPIPKGFILDHLCRVRCCVNPYHLEVVTHRDNILRGCGFAAVNAKKENCPAGHELSGENVYKYNGKRHCRECRKLRQHV